MREVIDRIRAFFSKSEADKTVNPLIRFFFYVCFFMLSVGFLIYGIIFFVERSHQGAREPASSPYRNIDKDR